MQPAILNIECKEDSAWAKYAKDFGEGAILQFFRTQVMKH